MQVRWRNVRDRWLTVNARDPEQRQRGQLLGILLTGLCALTLPLTAINGIQVAVAPSSDQAFYVVLDVCSMLVLAGLWLWNRRGHTRWASYTFLVIVVLGCSALFTMRDLDRSLIVYAIPIMAASFLIRPGNSFVFAGLSALGYSLAWLANGGAPPYNYVSVLALFVVALLAWLIAARLEKDRIERKRAEEALLRRAQELTALQATLLDITSPRPLPVLLRMIVERAANLLNAAGGGLYLTEPEHCQVRCVVTYNTLRDFTGTLLDYGVGAAGHVAQTGQPLIIDDYRTWSGRASVYEDGQSFQTVMSAPLLWQGNVTGVVEVLRQASSERFSQRDLDLLMMFANHAAVAVENARLHGALEQELAERQRAEEQLKETLAELERSNAELQQFAYIASHDLQEPLRMVTSYLQLLSKRYQGRLDAVADEFIGYAVDGAQRMQRLIADLLAYSRVGTRGNPTAPTDCQAALDQALANLEIAIEEAGATVTHDPLPTVLADEGQLVQLFQNLIGNAVKFHGDAPPCVHISARRIVDVSTVWEFSMRDNGIGIEPQQFERIFMVFQRLHTRAEYPGSGLGLAICKKIVERHGGRIWVESQPGQGSTFYFTLPVRRA